MSTDSSPVGVTIPNLRPDTKIIQEAIVNLKYPISYLYHLVARGVHSIECLSNLIENRLYEDLLTPELRIGHLVSIQIEGNKINRQPSETDGMYISYGFRANTEFVVSFAQQIIAQRL